MRKITDFLTIRQAADFLGVTPNTLRNWEREKKITPYRNPLNRYRLYKKEDLESAKITDSLTIKQAADFIGVTPNTLRNWEREKKLFPCRNPLNRYRLYKKEDLEAILNNIERA